VSIDEKDVRIVKAIADTETRSPSKIAEETGIPLSTVNYRLDTLRDEGIVRNDQYDIDLGELGLGITFIVEVIAEYDEGYHRDIGQEIREIDGVTQVYFTAGDTDFFVICRLADSDMVEELVSEFEAIDGVQRTISTYAIATIRDEHEPLREISTETLLERLVE
jgi:Lrp/AsnC family leucine-responsive transcriptional regulator